MDLNTISLSKKIVWIAELTIIAIFSFVFLYYSEPFGDDIATCFNSPLNPHLDGVELGIGDLTTNYTEVMKKTVFAYNKWSGRLTGYYFLYATNLFPKIIKAICGTLLLCANCLLLIRVAFGSWEEAARYPLVWLIVYFSMYWYRKQGFWTYMWTFICIYELSLALCLLFVCAVNKNNQRKSIVVYVFIVGLLAGLSHEIFAILTICWSGLDFISDLKNKKKKIGDCVRFAGLILGSLFCIFAPGNFNRMIQSHDSSIYTVGLSERILTSLKEHVRVLLPYKVEISFVIGILLFLIVFVHIKEATKSWKGGNRKVFAGIAPIIVSGLLSVVCWGVMSHVPYYGLNYWICLVFIFFIKLLRNVCGDARIIEKWLTTAECVIALSVVAFFSFDNIKWLTKYIEVREERACLIETAELKKEKQVIVPRYPHEAWSNLTYFDYLNNQEIYDLEFYDRYWGIHIIIASE